MKLSQNEFAAMFQRYVADQCTAAEQRQLDRWLAQSAQPSHPELTTVELAQVRAAMWQRIEEAMKGS